MKKLTKLLLACLVVSFASCSKDDGPDKKIDDDNLIVGTWRLQKITGQYYLNGKLEENYEIKEGEGDWTDITVTMTFRADGKGVLTAKPKVGATVTDAFTYTLTGQKNIDFDIDSDILDMEATEISQLTRTSLVLRGDDSYTDQEGDLHRDVGELHFTRTN